MVTGRATTLTHPDQIARYEQLLQPWVNMAIGPVIVTGIRTRVRQSRHVM